MKKKSVLSLALVLLAIVGLFLITQYGIDGKDTLSAATIDQGLDLKGGVSIIYEADKENPTVEEMNAANSMIRKRLDDHNYMDAETYISGGNRIYVDIPGVDDADQAISTLGDMAELSFIDLQGNVIITGADVASASAKQMVENSVTRYVVELKFKPEGRAKFAEGTANNIGSQIYILMDGMPISAPSVDEKIDSDTCIIKGNFDYAGAEELANRINSGALPFKLNLMASNQVGAKLGSDALNTSLKAGAIGFILVIIFMLVVYRAFGLAADLALLLFVGAEVVALAALNITLTLPGLAGIILSVGMAVDANIIIFERIKEEVVRGKSLRSATKSGFSRALPAIIDGNITTMIAGIILFWLGSGSIKGFAQTLILGIALSMFTALFITRLILTSFINIGISDKKSYGIK